MGTPDTIASALGLEFDLDRFLLYNLVHGFLFRHKQDRIEKESKTPLLPDLGARKGAAGEAVCATFVEKQYRHDYERRLAALAGQEQSILRDEHVAALLFSPTVEAFDELLKTGMTRGPIAFRIANSTSPGATQLHSQLPNADIDVPQRGKKLWTFITGTDRHGEAV